MILGTARRVRPAVVAGPDELVADQPAWPDPRDHRDRGHFLTPRLYPTAPFDPWEPVSVYTDRHASYAVVVAKESM